MSLSASTSQVTSSTSTRKQRGGRNLMSSNSNTNFPSPNILDGFLNANNSGNNTRGITTSPSNSGLNYSLKRGGSHSNDAHDVNFSISISGSVNLNASHEDVFVKGQKPAKPNIPIPKGNIQVLYEFYKDSIRSDFSYGPNFSWTNSHRVSVDDDWIVFLNDSFLEISVFFKSTVIRSQSEQGKGGKKGTTPNLLSQNIKSSSLAPSQSTAPSLHESKVRVSLFTLLDGESSFCKKFTGVELPIGVSDFQVTISVENGPIISATQRNRLNPLVIDLKKVKNLPFEPFSSFSNMNKECKPAYLSYKFYDGTNISSKGVPQAETMQFNYRRYFFTGLYDQDSFVEYLSTTPLCIEVHDRDKNNAKSIATESHEKTGKVDENFYSQNVLQEMEEEPLSLTSEILSESLNESFLYLTDSNATTTTNNSFGVATFPLDELISGMTKLKLKSEVLPLHPNHSRVNSISGNSKGKSYASDPLRYFSIHPPGQYVVHGTTLSITLDLFKPLSLDTIKPPSYSRLMYIFRSMSSEYVTMIHNVQQAITHINITALSLEDPTTLSTYALSPSQIEDKDNSLDIITGFQIMDGETVMICVEGLAEKGMKLLEVKVGIGTSGGPPTKNNPQTNVQVFSSSSLRFRRRMYNSLGIVGLKAIKLAQPLNQIISEHSLHLRSKPKISRSCYDAIHSLKSIQTLDELQQVKTLNLFPDSNMLLALERTFGMLLDSTDIRLKGMGLALSLEMNVTNNNNNNNNNDNEDNNNNNNNENNTENNNTPHENAVASLELDNLDSKGNFSGDTSIKLPLSGRLPHFKLQLQTMK